MSKYYIILLLASFYCAACNQPDKPPAATTTNKTQNAPANTLIIPGKSIGAISLNESIDTAKKLLGKPDYIDAAMGSVLLTWYAGHDTTANYTSIFAHHNFGGKDEAIAHIKKILVTSSVFTTGDGVSTGATLKDISSRYHLQLNSHYIKYGKTISIYSDIKKGIAFEIEAGNKCTAIIVFKPNDTPSAYINMH